MHVEAIKLNPWKLNNRKHMSFENVQNLNIDG